MAVEIKLIEAHAEVFRGLENTVIKDNLHLFLPPDDPRKWQTSDFLPDVARDGVSTWQDKCALLRRQAQTLTKPARVVNAGNGITEAGLALFAAALARLRGLEDTTGIDDTPLAQSRRRWFGDENRHHTSTYMYASLSGIYDMKALDRTIHMYHINGFDNEAGLDIYRNLQFVVKQEGHTQTAHQRMGLTAKEQQQAAGDEGESVLYSLLMAISKDEASHHVFYRNIMEGVIQQDPEGAVIAIRDMMKVGIIMPARFMGDINSRNEVRSSSLFDRYAKVGSRLGILTLLDDIELDESLMKRWKVANLRVFSEAADAQADIFRIIERRKRSALQLEERRLKQNREEGEPDVTDFSWLLPEAT